MTAPADVLAVMKAIARGGDCDGITNGDVAQAIEAVAELIEAAEKVLSLPVARNELGYLRKGIGTSTPTRAWLDLEAAIARVGGAK